MKVSELRLGNYICHNGEVMPVVQIERRYKTIYRLNDIDVDERMIEDHFQPIPLTPEWLNRCGFEPSSLNDLPNMASNNYHFGPICVKVKNEISVWDYDGPAISVKYHKNIKHIHSIHQLQNLYFALTGEELTIKELV